MFLGRDSRDRRMVTNTRLLAAIIILAGTTLQIWSAYQLSPAVDEVAHLAAGVSHWQLGKFGLYRVNPPLARMVASIPVLFLRPLTDWTQYADGPGDRTDFYVGKRFVRLNKHRILDMYFVARLAVIPFTVLGGVLCMRWSTDLYGEEAGMLTLLLWYVSPNVRGYGQWITPDMAATAIGLGANYLFWRWLISESLPWRSGVWMGFVLGLAQTTKTTWIILYGVWPAVFCIVLIALHGYGAWKRLVRGCLILVIAFLLSLVVINMVYGWEGTFTRVRDFQFVSRTLSGKIGDVSRFSTGNRFVNCPVAKVPVPLPRNYVYGIDMTKYEFEIHQRSYLRGQWKWSGWWWYYVYALLVKTPTGTLAAIALSVYVVCRFRSGAFCTWQELSMLVPGVAVLLFVSSQTGYNHHVRYVLPVLPYVFIWIGRTIRLDYCQPSIVRVVAYVCVLTSGLSAAAQYPHCTSYFNYLCGGPRNGHAHLVDSNIDWGQDLLKLRRWLAENPHVGKIGLAYYGKFHPRLLGIDFEVPPEGGRRLGFSPKDDRGIGPQPGVFAISVNFLRGSQFPIPLGDGTWSLVDGPAFSYFNAFQPIDTAGYSIYIYRITPEDIDEYWLQGVE